MIWSFSPMLRVGVLLLSDIMLDLLVLPLVRSLWLHNDQERSWAV
jgi:hypothetical protein